jgi:hypothetical protein
VGRNSSRGTKGPIKETNTPATHTHTHTNDVYKSNEKYLCIDASQSTWTRL